MIKNKIDAAASFEAKNNDGNLIDSTITQSENSLNFLPDDFKLKSDSSDTKIDQNFARAFHIGKKFESDFFQTKVLLLRQLQFL